MLSHLFPALAIPAAITKHRPKTLAFFITLSIGLKMLILTENRT
jgi:hypothetical protein